MKILIKIVIAVLVLFSVLVFVLTVKHSTADYMRSKYREMIKNDTIKPIDSVQIADSIKIDTLR